MSSKRKRRLYAIIAIIIGVGSAISLSLFALRQDVDLYLTPSQALQHSFTSQQNFRLGGIVKKGSFYRKPGTLEVQFILTDYQQEIKVYYVGMLPTLFREGQGIVVQGHFNAKHILIADQVLAKHDAKYMPPGIH